MNKSILTAGLALLLSACFTEPAHAWLNTKFGIGLNWSLQSGGNNFLWGAFRNGQPPAPAPQQHPGFMPGGGPGYGPHGHFPQFYQSPGFGGGAPMMQGPSQAGDVIPSFHPVSFPGQYIPETDYSESYDR